MEAIEPYLTDEDFDGLVDVIEVCRLHTADVLATQAALLERIPQELIPPGDPEVQFAEGLDRLSAAVAARDFSDYVERQRASTAQLAEQRVPYSLITFGLMQMVEPLAKAIEVELESDPARRMRALRSLHRMETMLLRLTGEVYANARENQVEDAFQSVIRRLSTPVIEVWDQVLVMPLIGVLDTSRAQQMMEQMLERIVERQARIIIVDITGVPTVDTAVAQHLIRATKAGKLVGADALLVGISPQVAQTLVRLGVTLDGIETYTDLRSGLARALQLLGYHITRKAS